jgi:hypothetical protein
VTRTEWSDSHGVEWVPDDGGSGDDGDECAVRTCLHFQVMTLDT